MEVWHKLPQYFLFNELTPDPSIIWIIHNQLERIKWPPRQCITNTAWRGKRGLDDAASKMRHSEANDSTCIPSRLQERSFIYLSYLVKVCLTMLWVIHAGTLLNNESERIRKEQVVVQFELQLTRFASKITKESLSGSSPLCAITISNIKMISGGWVKTQHFITV